MPSGDPIKPILKSGLAVLGHTGTVSAMSNMAFSHRDRIRPEEPGRGTATQYHNGQRHATRTSPLLVGEQLDFRQGRSLLDYFSSSLLCPITNTRQWNLQLLTDLRETDVRYVVSLGQLPKGIQSLVRPSTNLQRSSTEKSPITKALRQDSQGNNAIPGATLR